MYVLCETFNGLTHQIKDHSILFSQDMLEEIISLPWIASAVSKTWERALLADPALGN